MIFLIAQRFDRSGVEHALAFTESGGNQIFTDKGLAGPGLGCHEHVVAGVDAENGMFLEGIQFVFCGKRESFGVRRRPVGGRGHCIGLYQ